jgi:hypothetical protein
LHLGQQCLHFLGTLLHLPMQHLRPCVLMAQLRQKD